jgi:hypothetical protein
MIEIDYTFKVETAREDAVPWWVSCPVGGTLAVGSGHTVWEALAACITDIPRTIEFCRGLDRALGRAEAGTFTCPRCGALRPPLNDFWAFYCDVCRGESTEL